MNTDIERLIAAYNQVKPTRDGFILTYVSPLGEEGVCTQTKVCNPVPQTGIPIELYRLFLEIKKWLGENQATFVLHYDGNNFRLLG